MGIRERRGFRGLDVWQKGMDAVERIYGVTQRFPREEMFGLTSQIRRAAVSVPLNSAEGYKRRRYAKDYLRLLVTAHGSEAEVETALEIADRLGYVTTEECDDLLVGYDEIGRMLSGLITSVEKGMPGRK